MDSKLMCLLTVNGNKYKLVIDASEKWVPFSGFKSYIENKLPHLSFIFESYVFEVYDPDFEEYIKLEKYDRIEHMSRLRAVSHSSYGKTSCEALNTPKVASTPPKGVITNSDVKSEQKVILQDSVSDNNALQINGSLPEKAVQTKRIRRRRKRRTSKSSVGSVNSAKSDGSLLAFEEPKLASEASDNRNTSNQLGFTTNQPSFANANFVSRSRPLSESDTTSPNKNSVSKTARKTEIRDTSSRSCSQEADISIAINKGKVVFQEFGKVCLYESDFIINDLTSSYSICEVLCKFNRYFCEHDNAWEADDIWRKAAKHLSEITKVRISMTSLKETFSNLLSQYIKIIMYLVGWDEDDCSNLWPLFPMFHYELILIPFRNDIEHLIRNFNHNSKRNAKFSLRSLAKRKSMDENFSIFNVLKGKSLLPLKQKVRDNPLEQDFKILDAVKKYQWEFKNNRKSLTVVWDKIQYEVNKRSSRCFTALECRQRFELLLNQYSTMLTFMKEFTFDQCRKLWPLFAPFHCEIDFHSMNKKILNLKQEFDDCEKLEEECSDQELNSEAIDEAEIELKLVASISDHIESLMSKCINEDDFWQKIAYDLSFYETPVESSSKVRWQLMFCGIVDKYMKGESKNEQLNNDLHQILERIYDITTD